MGETPEEYKVGTLPISSDKWSLLTEKIIVNSTETDISCEIHFDTGSTTLILNSKVYQLLFSFIDKFMLSNDCFQMKDKLAYMCYESGMDFNQEIVF